MEAIISMLLLFVPTSLLLLVELLTVAALLQHGQVLGTKSLTLFPYLLFRWCGILPKQIRSLTQQGIGCHRLNGLPRLLKGFRLE